MLILLSGLAAQLDYWGYRVKPIAGNLGHIRQAIMRDSLRERPPNGPTDISVADAHNPSSDVG